MVVVSAPTWLGDVAYPDALDVAIGDVRALIHELPGGQPHDPQKYNIAGARCSEVVDQHY